MPAFPVDQLRTCTVDLLANAQVNGFVRLELQAPSGHVDASWQAVDLQPGVAQRKVFEATPTEAGQYAYRISVADVGGVIQGTDAGVLDIGGAQVASGPSGAVIGVSALLVGLGIALAVAGQKEARHGAKRSS